MIHMNLNPGMQIRSALPEHAHVTQEVYNRAGQQMVTLGNEFHPAGWNDVNFDASGMSGSMYTGINFFPFCPRI
jgi:hypothetical protein